jgi:hypothetical protein
MSIAKMVLRSELGGLGIIKTFPEWWRMADNPKSKPKSLKLLIIIVIGVLLLGAAGGGAWLFFFKGKPSSSPATAASNGHIYKMKPFLVNLADPGQPRYLKVILHLESNQEKPSGEKGNPSSGKRSLPSFPADIIRT